ncbi:MAG: hypothetical protein ACRBCS_05265 [Cellvibrionaceae bacterium]
MKTPTLKKTYQRLVRLAQNGKFNHCCTVFFLLTVFSCFFCSHASADTSNPATSNSAKEELLVVMNITNAPTLTKQQIRHVFMGGRLSRKYKAINLPSGHPLRIKFNTKIIGLTESRIQSYWAQMKFTGRSEPPIEASNTEELLSQLVATEGAMAYLPAGLELPQGLTIIYP